MLLRSQLTGKMEPPDSTARPVSLSVLSVSLSLPLSLCVPLCLCVCSSGHLRKRKRGDSSDVFRREEVQQLNCCTPEAPACSIFQFRRRIYALVACLAISERDREAALSHSTTQYTQGENWHLGDTIEVRLMSYTSAAVPCLSVVIGMGCIHMLPGREGVRVFILFHPSHPRRGLACLVAPRRPAGAASVSPLSPSESSSACIHFMHEAKKLPVWACPQPMDRRVAAT